MSSSERPYVPGYSNDVFISYAHNDNISHDSSPGWVTAFSKRLEVTLKGLLGSDVRVWRDEERTSPDRILDDELQRQVNSSAVFVAIVSPSYLNSSFCTDERNWFLEANAGTIRLGTSSRGLRVVRLPLIEGDAHRQIFADGLGGEFFERKGEYLEELSPMSTAFGALFERLCQGIARLLHQMRRDCTPVYLAACRRDLRRHRQALVDELTSLGYSVLPSVELAGDLLEVAKEELSRARLSVHVFDAIPHTLSNDQARLAMDLQGKILVWALEPELYKADLDNRELLWRLFGTATYLEPPNARPEKVKAEVLALLSARDRAEVPALNGDRRIYIICDSRDPDDYRRARKIRDLIVRNDKFEVDLSEAGPLDPGEIREDHERKLRMCHGVLLYWGTAERDWFDAMRGDLLSRRFLSNAIALGEGRDRSGVNHHTVLPLDEEFAYAELDPLLEPLRRK